MKTHRRFTLASMLALFFGPTVEVRAQERPRSAPEVYPSSDLKAQETKMSLSGVADLAQEPRPTEPVDTVALPTRVRLTMTDGSRLKFELLRVEPGRLVVRAPGRLQQPSFNVPIAEVSAAQRSLGRRRGRAAALGGSIGALVGFIFLGSGDLPCNVAICVPLFVGPPALLGAGLGALVAGEGWEPLPLPQTTGSVASAPVSRDSDLAETAPGRQVGFSITPTHDRGVQARLSISWR